MGYFWHSASAFFFFVDQTNLYMIKLMNLFIVLYYTVCSKAVVTCHVISRRWQTGFLHKGLKERAYLQLVSSWITLPVTCYQTSSRNTAWTGHQSTRGNGRHFCSYIGRFRNFYQANDDGFGLWEGTWREQTREVWREQTSWNLCCWGSNHSRADTGDTL